MKEGREEQGDAFASLRRQHVHRSGHATTTRAPTPRDRCRNAAPNCRLTLDAAGGARATVKDVGTMRPVPRDLVAELEYRDPNGETLTAATRVALWPSRVVLGIKPDGWVAIEGEAQVHGRRASISRGKPLAGVRVRTDAFKREYLFASAPPDRRLLRLRARHRNDARRRTLCAGDDRRAGPADLRSRGARHRAI